MTVVTPIAATATRLNRFAVSRIVTLLRAGVR